MKQILIRCIPQCPGVVEACVGRIVDGQFNPDQMLELDDVVASYIHADSVFGMQAYILMNSFSNFLRDVLNAGFTVMYYPQFICITYPETSHEQKKKKDEE